MNKRGVKARDFRYALEELVDTFASILGGAFYGTTRTLKGASKGLKEAGSGLGHAAHGAGYLAKGTGRAIRGLSEKLAHAHGGSYKLPIREFERIAAASPTLKSNYFSTYLRARSNRKPYITIPEEDLDRIINELDKSERGSSRKRYAAAVLFLILSAVFLASTTPSITGYSVLSAGGFYNYIPFLGAISLIASFILLLTD